MRNRVKRVISIGALLLISGTVFAQADDDAQDQAASEQDTAVVEEQSTAEPAADSPADQAASTAASAPVAEVPASAATMERFDPSEDVSEDRSVSFPVDI